MSWVGALFISGLLFLFNTLICDSWILHIPHLGTEKPMWWLQPAGAQCLQEDRLGLHNFSSAALAQSWEGAALVQEWLGKCASKQ